MKLLKYTNIICDIGSEASTREGRVKTLLPNNNAPRDCQCDFVFRLNADINSLVFIISIWKWNLAAEP